MVEGPPKPINQTPVYQTDQYQIFRDGVVQKKFVATALSPTKIISNYVSLAQNRLSPIVYFKFGLNGHDNEMAYGCNHFIYCITTAGLLETPLIKFGSQFTDDRDLPANLFLEPNTSFKIKLDLRDVLAAFKNQGYFITNTGEKINAVDFKGIFVAGSVAPLTWDFYALPNNPELALQDENQDGIFELTLILNPQPAAGKEAWAQWSLTKVTDQYPQLKSEFQLVNAVYNLALEELMQAIEPDNTFRTGKEWAGVWTRDISYSIILALAAIAPAVSKHSLLEKICNGRIIQDTGTGGAYPVSTDRQIWAIAAWEIYVVTGDQNWLRQAYQIIRNSLADDYLHVYDSRTGLVKGESSFLDWREQTYPAWMQPADIFESECLGTNAVHYQANVVLAQMAGELKEEGAALKFSQTAEAIKTGLNTYLWQPERGYYCQFLYGRKYKIPSPRAEALGEALCVLFDIANPEQQQQIIQKVPVGNFGIPCISPQIPNVPPYHNQAVWPFVQAFWSLATAKISNQTALTESISAVYRATALFLTNKENFVSATGDFGGTQINSDNMLWSLAGNLSITYRIFFGMHFNPGGISFKPCVPPAYNDEYRLINFNYRHAILDIFLEGSGNVVQSFFLNGQILPIAKIPNHLVGRQEIKIKLTEPTLLLDKMNKGCDLFSPATPEVNQEKKEINWLPVKDAVAYQIIKNGKRIFSTTKTSFPFMAGSYAEYQIIAVDAAGKESFASEPLVVAATTILIYKIGKVNEKGWVEINTKVNPILSVSVAIPEAGNYAIDVKYANGNGPIETDNKCAFRALLKGGEIIGTLVMPQRGQDAWLEWGYSNALITFLKSGNILFSLAYLPSTENMNREINQAYLDHIRFTRIE